MTRSDRSRYFVAFAVSLLPLFCLGCAAHRNDSLYRLTTVDSQYFIIAGLPEIAGERQQFEISLERAGGKQQHAVSEGCSIQGAWFSLYPARSNWKVETPSAAAWAAASGHTDLRAEWATFLHQILVLQQRQCFAASATFLGIKEKIVEGMAIPADDALLYRYSFGQGGFVDLGEEMELRIERNLATGSVAASAKTAGGVQTIVTTYGFSDSSDNSSVRINFLGSQDNGKFKAVLPPNIPDTTLATTFQAVPHLRLILQRLSVAASVDSPAILLGGGDLGALDQATASAVADPKITCDSLHSPRIQCVEFTGLVTVSPVLRVKVNGRAQYAPLGSKVAYVFPPAADSSSSILKTLRIRRQYGKSRRLFKFAATEEEINQILLFGGDEISWAKPAHPSPVRVPISGSL